MTLTFTDNISYTVTKGFEEKPKSKYLKNFIEMEERCSTFIDDEMLNSEFVKSFTETFELNCKGMHNCTLPIDYRKLPPKCLTEVAYRSKFSA